MVNGIAKLLLRHAGLPLAARAGRASRPLFRSRRTRSRQASTVDGGLGPSQGWWEL